MPEHAGHVPNTSPTRTPPTARAPGWANGRLLEAVNRCRYPWRTATGAPPPRDALEWKGAQRWPQKRLGRRLEEVAKEVGGGYCRLQMPLKLALAVGGAVAGHRLGALGGGGGGEGTFPPSNASLAAGVAREAPPHSRPIRALRSTSISATAGQTAGAQHRTTSPRRLTGTRPSAIGLTEVGDAPPGPTP